MSIPPKIGALLTLLLVGFLVGNVLLLWPWPTTAQVEFFTGTPEFLVWLSLVSVLFAVLPLCAFYGLSVAMRLQRTVGPFSRRSLFALFILLLLFLLPFGTLAHFPDIFPLVDLPSFELRVNLVTLFCGICAEPIAISLIWLGLAIHQLRPEIDTFPEIYFLAKRDLSGLVGAIGLIIGLGTLTTGALQNALAVLYEEFGLANNQVFPPILAVVYGAYFSLILVVIYWPLEKALLDRASKYLDIHIPLPPLAAANWSERHSLRQQAATWLGLETALLTPRSALVIFTPLLSGLLAYLLPG